MKAGQEHVQSGRERTECLQGGTRKTEGQAGRKDRSRTVKPGEEGKVPKPRQSPAPVVSGDGIMGNPGGNEKIPEK